MTTTDTAATAAWQMPAIAAPAAVTLAIVLVAAAATPLSRRPVRGALQSRHRSRRGSSSRWIHAVARLRATRRNRQVATAEEVATWCEALARRVRAGASLRHAVETVEPATTVVQRHVEPLRRRLGRGTPLADAAADTGDDGADLRLALDMIGVAATLGGSPAAALDRTAVTLRQRATDRAERRTQAAQARISAHVLTVVPLALLGLLMLSDQRTRSAVTTPVGAACIAGGLLLNGLGWIWMRAVIGRPR